MSAEVQTVSFSIDGEGFTQIARGIFADGKSASALDLLLQGLDGITLEQSFAVLTGKNKLVNDPDSSSLGLDGDDAELEFPAYDDQPPRDLHGLLLRLKWFEERQEAFRKLTEFTVLIHRACGKPLYRSPVMNRGSSNYSSPVGMIHTRDVCEYISRYLPEPTDEEWDAFWEDHKEPYCALVNEKEEFFEAHPEKETDERGYPKHPLEGGKYGGFIVDAAPNPNAIRDAVTSGDPLAYIRAQLELDTRPCPKPDQDMESPDGWILPTGEYYPCGYMEHPWLAGKLIPDADNAERDAERRGWVKIHASGLISGYDTGMCINPPHRGDNACEPTARQVDAIFRWCERHRQELPHWMAPESAREFHPAPDWKPTPRRQDMTGD